MATYKILGSKEINYYIIVEADDKLQAYDIASNEETHKWEQLEEDSVIEPFEIIEM